MEIHIDVLLVLYEDYLTGGVWWLEVLLRLLCVGNARIVETAIVLPGYLE